MLKGKTVILGVSGSIAAYKIANLASMLVKLQCEVHVIMTKNATNFINPITFEALTNQKCLVDTFDRNFQYHVGHIALAHKADVVLLAPASANVIGKVANGIGDDMLTTTVLACKCKKIIAPAMNTNMYENPIVQDNIEKLKKYGMEIISPDSGRLACGDVGAGKLVPEEVLLEGILREIQYPKTLSGKKVLVTAGATRESIDPVRFITNYSTGKMGYAIAKEAMKKGAEVLLITGNASVPLPHYVEAIKAENAREMFQAVKDYYEDCHIIVKAAAVADYTPETVKEEKIKKADGLMSISLKRTRDILKWLGEHKRQGQFLCGFSMETENMLENSRIKLEKKNADMIVANNLKMQGAGFGVDTNIITLITRNGDKELPCMSKEEAAANLLDEIAKMME